MDGVGGAQCCADAVIFVESCNGRPGPNGLGFFCFGRSDLVMRGERILPDLGGWTAMNLWSEILGEFGLLWTELASWFPEWG